MTSSELRRTRQHNHWTLLRELPMERRDGRRFYYGDFQCVCGKVSKLIISAVAQGGTQSCGCQYNHRGATLRTHGQTGSRCHRAWKAMNRRCAPSNETDAASYSERGITVCDRWKFFEAFAADMGSPPVGTTLDRRDSNLGYSPENCRWATAHRQARNTRRNLYVNLDGKWVCLKDTCARLGLRYGTVIAARNRGAPLAKFGITEIKTYNEIPHV